MSQTPLNPLDRVARRLAQEPQVVAVALGGSRAAGNAAHDSDFDVYVFVHSHLPAAARLAMAHEFSPDAQLNDFWGPGLEWDMPEDGAHFDIVYFKADWIEAQLTQTLDRHQASLGYTTSFVHTVKVAQPLHDTGGWFAALQHRAQQPYPEALAENIIALNLPLLRSSMSSYPRQIAKAVRRYDLVSVNHRVAAFLSSVFDIIFAMNRMMHPGEKRLLSIVERDCAIKPRNFPVLIETVLQACASGDESLLVAVDALVAELEQLNSQRQRHPVS